jgi:hypothetical protein
VPIRILGAQDRGKMRFPRTGKPNEHEQFWGHGFPMFVLYSVRLSGYLVQAPIFLQRFFY